MSYGQLTRSVFPSPNDPVICSLFHKQQVKSERETFYVHVYRRVVIIFYFLQCLPVSVHNQHQQEVLHCVGCCDWSVRPTQHPVSIVAPGSFLGHVNTA